MKLSAEQMQFLADRGMSIAEVIEFARMGGGRSAAAERQARYRERKKAEAEACDATSDVTRDASRCDETPPLPPPNDIYSNPPLNPPNSQSGARDAFPCPEWCETAVWRDLKRNRAAKKLANTETAHRKFVAAVLGMADDEWPPGRLVEAIAANGWGGAYDPRTIQNDRKPRNDRSPPSNRNTAELALAKLGMAGG